MSGDAGSGEPFEQAVALIVDVWPHEGAGSEMHVGDIAWGVFHRWPSALDSLRLWSVEQGPPQALTMFDGSGVCDLVVRPGDVGLEAARLALDWAEAACRDAAVSAEQVELRVGRRIHEPPLLQLLEDRGLSPRSVGAPAMSRSIGADDVAESVVPDGYRIRQLRSDELPQRVRAFRAAFPDDELCVDAYRALRECSVYNPRLDVVATAQSDSIVAFATLWFDTQNMVVQIEPAGCHPDHRRLGLTQAVIFHALRIAVERGASEALVRHNSDNLAARALYKSCGFSAACEHVGLSKTLDTMTSH